ncbi:FHA domain-containing protein [Myxococcota bacterium]
MARTRYRLRFLLQEIDLRPGETLIGRSGLCHVTIEDPLVSRQHSRVVIGDVGAWLEDLGSRNGTFVNGFPIQGRHLLADSDRIRVGTLELVFCQAPDALPDPPEGKRTTGFMCHCSDCGTAYPAEVHQCPHCGSERRVDDDTISGVIGETQRNWTLELLVEVLGRALALARWEDVERMLGRARANIEGRLAGQASVDRSHLDAVAEAAFRCARVKGEVQWAVWILGIYASVVRLPQGAALAELERLPPSTHAQLAGSAGHLVQSIQSGGGPPAEDRLAFSRLQALAALAPLSP